jgi:hypothetical protein
MATAVVRELLFLLRGVARCSARAQSACPAQRLAQNVLDLRVDAPQFVLGPALHGVEDVGTDTKWIGFLLGQSTDPSGVQAARIDDRLRTAFATEHHEQVRNHCGLSFLVELHDAAFRELIERHVHH